LWQQMKCSPKNVVGQGVGAANAWWDTLSRHHFSLFACFFFHFLAGVLTACLFSLLPLPAVSAACTFVIFFLKCCLVVVCLCGLTYEECFFFLFSLPHVWCWTCPGDSSLGQLVLLVVVCTSCGSLCVLTGFCVWCWTVDCILVVSRKTRDCLWPQSNIQPKNIGSKTGHILVLSGTMRDIKIKRLNQGISALFPLTSLAHSCPNRLHVICSLC